MTLNTRPRTRLVKAARRGRRHSRVKEMRRFPASFGGIAHKGRRRPEAVRFGASWPLNRAPGRLRIPPAECEQIVNQRVTTGDIAAHAHVPHALVRHALGPAHLRCLPLSLGSGRHIVLDGRVAVRVERVQSASKCTFLEMLTDRDVLSGKSALHFHLAPFSTSMNASHSYFGTKSLGEYLRMIPPRT